MRPMLIEEFARRSGGEIHGVAPEAQITGFAWDSRDVAPGSLFLAITGERADGHNFVQDAMHSGAVAALVERPVEAPHVLVPNLVRALARFARSKREEFHGPVIAVTGSNGKTATKDMLGAACSPLGPLLVSYGNRNTEYTSPLLWAELEPVHKAVITEMAMRGSGQIAHLTLFSLPTIGVVTMIGTAHIEKVGSREGIFRAKSELLRALPHDGLAVLWAEDDFFGQLRTQASCRRVSFGFSPDADAQIMGYRSLGLEECLVSLRVHGEIAECRLPTVGRHQARNLAAALLVATEVGVPLEDAAKAAATVKLQPMRMELRELCGARVLLDNYNASPDSTVAAIETLSELPVSGRRLAILGEMRELGDFSESGHRLVGKALSRSNIEGVVLYGGDTDWIADEAVELGYRSELIRKASNLDQLRSFMAELAEGDVLLIKGSRALELERVLEPEEANGPIR